MTCKNYCVNDFKIVDDCCDYVPLPSFAVVDGNAPSLDLAGKNFDGISWTNNSGDLTITNASAYKSLTLKVENAGAGSNVKINNSNPLPITNNVSLLVVDSGDKSKLL